MILNGQGRQEHGGSTTITECADLGHRLASSSSAMVAAVAELPCMEASRCFVKERERGLLISMKHISSPRFGKSGGDRVELELTKQRNRQGEWYLQLDETPDDHGTYFKCITFQHTEMGHYLHSTADGMVGTQEFQSHWTKWILIPSKSGSQNGSSQSFTFQDSQDFLSDMSVYYQLAPKADPTLRLSCKRTKDGGTLVLKSSEQSDNTLWELEFSSGELCYISNPVVHSQIRCNLFGQLSLSSVFQGWEVFRFIEVGQGNVAISSWTHSHKYLSSDPHGDVFTSENRLGHWEKWRLIKVPNGVYIVSVAHPGRYLCVGRHKEIPLETTTKPGDFAKWHLEAAHLHVYYISHTIPSKAGVNESLYVSSRRNGAVLSKSRRSWEEWKMEKADDGCVTFQSPTHEKFLGSNSSGHLHMTSSKGEWSYWEIIESPNGGSLIRSKLFNRVLSVDNGSLCTLENSQAETKSSTFQLQPRLPATMSGPRLAAIGVAGAVGVALTVSMPFAVLGVMQVAGLATTEVAVLAGVSAEALVGAGSGALMGAGVVRKAASAIRDDTQRAKLSPTAEGKDASLLEAQRPICAWRHW